MQKSKLGNLASGFLDKKERKKAIRKMGKKELEEGMIVLHKMKT
jgi:hypothetical protein